MIPLAALLTVPAILIGPQDLPRAHWKVFPSLADAYPETTSPDEMEYTTILRCRIVSRAGRVSCIHVAEDPAGFGVGEEAARIITKGGVIDMARTEGAYVGAVVVVGIDFRIADQG